MYLTVLLFFIKKRSWRYMGAARLLSVPHRQFLQPPLADFLKTAVVHHPGSQPALWNHLRDYSKEWWEGDWNSSKGIAKEFFKETSFIITLGGFSTGWVRNSKPPQSYWTQHQHPGKMPGWQARHYPWTNQLEWTWIVTFAACSRGQCAALRCIHIFTL